MTTRKRSKKGSCVSSHSWQVPSMAALIEIIVDNSVLLYSYVAGTRKIFLIGYLKRQISIVTIVLALFGVWVANQLP